MDANEPVTGGATLTACARLEDVAALLPKQDYVTIAHRGVLEVTRRGPAVDAGPSVTVILNGWGRGFVLSLHALGPDRHDQAGTPGQAADLVKRLI